jgi:transposase
VVEVRPGGAGKRDLTALQARRMLAPVRPRDPAGATRRRLAMDHVTDLEVVDGKLKALKAELRIAVRRNGSTLMDLHGIGPAGAARLLVDVGTIARCPSKGHFAVLERDGPTGGVVWGAGPSPALPGREPADQPCPAHHLRRPTAQRHPGAAVDAV